ncbi:MAG: xylulokinase [Verrucomicrobiota bacterium]
MISIGIDCGTQSLKAIALDAESGEILASASQSYGMISNLSAGHMEQDPGVWIEALEISVQKVLKKIENRKSEVLAFGVSGQQHGFVPLDSENRVIRPAKLWCDTSTTAQCDQIRNHFGGRSPLIELIGNDVLPGFTAPKILWLKQNEPENFKKLHTVLLPHDYLNWYLTSKFFMEYGDASGTALLDVRKRSWSDPLIDFIDIDLRRKLPTLQSSLIPGGFLNASLAKSWGLSSNVVISAGGGDNMMGAIGTANLEKGIVTASLGTSGTIFSYSDTPIIDPQGEIAAFCDSTNGWLPLLCTMNVTIVTEALSRMFEWNHQQLAEEIDSIPVGSDGLLLLPFLQGERTPNLPQGCGTFHGLTLKNMTKAHFARATMEGITFGMAYGLGRLRELGIIANEIRLTGGGSRNSVWRQICADIFNVPVVTLKNAEGAALGAALQALSGVSSKSISELTASLIRKDESTRAIPQQAEAYRVVKDGYNRILSKLYT